MGARSSFAWAARLAATLAMILLGASGCVPTTSNAATNAANAPPRVESRQLARGVELRVSEEAGPDAIEAADQIEREFRSRYAPAMRYTHTSEHYSAPTENTSMR